MGRRTSQLPLVVAHGSGRLCRCRCRLHLRGLVEGGRGVLAAQAASRVDLPYLAVLRLSLGRDCRRVLRRHWDLLLDEVG